MGVGLVAWRRVHAHSVGELVCLGLLAMLAVFAAPNVGIDLESSFARGTFVHRWGGHGAVDQKSERKDHLRRVKAKTIGGFKGLTFKTVAICMIEIFGSKNQGSDS